MSIKSSVASVTAGKLKPENTTAHRPNAGPGLWTGVELHHYKQEGSAPFRAVSRQVLFADPQLAAQLRYFEVQAGGYTTLERHQHMHAVMVLHGGGRALVGEELFELAQHDLITVPALTWHQFRARKDAPLGFLCMVNTDRDRPQLPRPEELDAMLSNPKLAAFLQEQSG